MIRRALLVAAAGTLALAASVVPGASADGPGAVVAGPGASRGAGYTTPVVPVRVGDQPVLVNADVTWHGLVSTDAGPDDRPWCGPADPSKPEDPVRNRRRFPLGQCPLFWAEYARGAGGTSVVLGLDAASVASGRVYEFACPLVEGMTGNFFVV